MVGHTMRYGVQRSVDVCSVLRNMCSLCRKGRAGSSVSSFRGAGSPVSGFKFLVSRAHPLCPPKIGVTRSKAPEGVCYKVKGEM